METEQKPVGVAYSCTITATPQGIHIETNMTGDLLLATLWQAVQVVSAQVIQQGIVRIIPVKGIRTE